jgi:hypothetical protein
MSRKNHVAQQQEPVVANNDMLKQRNDRAGRQFEDKVISPINERGLAGNGLPSNLR